MDPDGGWSTAGASPLLRRPVTVPRLGADSEDLVYPVYTSGKYANKINSETLTNSESTLL